MRWISPYDTLDIESALWKRILASYPLQLEVIRYLCTRIIKSAEGDCTRGQSSRANYRLWQVETLYRGMSDNLPDIYSLVAKARCACTAILERHQFF